MTIGGTNLTQALLAELANEEVALISAEQHLSEARIKFDVASHKYAAVRDMVIDRLGFSPYTIHFAGWPMAGRKLGDTLGKHRFLHMKPGDAAITVLKEVESAITLEEIVDKLRGGGIRYPESMLNRMINAALMKTKGIEKTEDGKYSYEEEEEDKDVPF